MIGKGAGPVACSVTATLTSGKPQLFYTAVDNAKAAIAQAFPMDDALLEWKKDEQNPIITGKPAGLSDDFRDPYIFTHNGKVLYDCWYW